VCGVWAGVVFRVASCAAERDGSGQFHPPFGGAYPSDASATIHGVQNRELRGWNGT
jgi:hypothetical protein